MQIIELCKAGTHPITLSVDKSRTHGTLFLHLIISRILINCGNSSIGRALPCQGKGRGFESRFPLHTSQSFVWGHPIRMNLIEMSEIFQPRCLCSFNNKKSMPDFAPHSIKRSPHSPQPLYNRDNIHCKKAQ